MKIEYYDCINTILNYIKENIKSIYYEKPIRCQLLNQNDGISKGFSLDFENENVIIYCYENLYPEKSFKIIYEIKHEMPETNIIYGFSMESCKNTANAIVNYIENFLGLEKSQIHPIHPDYEMNNGIEMLVIVFSNGKVQGINRSNFSYPIHILVADYDNPYNENRKLGSKTCCISGLQCLVRPVWEGSLMPKNTEN